LFNLYFKSEMINPAYFGGEMFSFLKQNGQNLAGCHFNIQLYINHSEATDIAHQRAKDLGYETATRNDVCPKYFSYILSGTKYFGLESGDLIFSVYRRNLLDRHQTELINPALFEFDDLELNFGMQAKEIKPDNSKRKERLLSIMGAESELTLNFNNGRFGFGNVGLSEADRSEGDNTLVLVREAGLEKMLRTLTAISNDERPMPKMISKSDLDQPDLDFESLPEFSEFKLKQAGIYCDGKFGVFVPGRPGRTYTLFESRFLNIAVQIRPMIRE